MSNFNFSDSSVNDCDLFDLAECQNQLKELYRGPETRIQLLPWDPRHTAEIEAIFVNLELIKDEVSPSQTKQVPLKSNEDLVNLQTVTGSRVNRILIQGNVGSGKSTLLTNIAYKWALQNNDLLLQFELVFLIHVQKIGSRTDTLEEVIFSQLLEETPCVSQDGLKSYIKSNAEKILFLIDGIDEENIGIFDGNVGVQKMDKTDMYALLTNKMLKKSCVILSICPHKLKEMTHEQRHYILVRLAGFSDENIELYINKFFAGHKNRCTELIQVLKTNRNLLDLAGTPILLLFFCLLWNDDQPSHQCLPDTKTKLYQETIESFWKRYHYQKNTLMNEDLDSVRLHIQFYQFLKSLGKTALIDITKTSVNIDKTIFSESEFENGILDLALQVGIVSRERTTTKLRSKSSVKFLHSSLQNFCSGIYLAELFSEDRLKFDHCIDHLVANLSLPIFEVIEFSCGFMPKTVRPIAEKYFSVNMQRIKYKMQLHKRSMRSKVQQCKHFELSFFLNMVFEAQLPYKECLKLVPICSNTPVPLGLIWTPNFSLPRIQYQLKLLEPVAKSCKGLFFSNINYICFEWPIEFPQHLHLIQGVLTYTKMVEFLVLNFKVCPRDVQMTDLDMLVKVLGNLKRLKSFALLRQTSKNQNITDISNILGTMGGIKYLTLVNVNCTAAALSKLLRSSKTLKSISVIGNTEQSAITERHKIKNIMSELSGMAKLSVLEFRHVDIGGAIIKQFKHLISTLQKLVLASTSLRIQDLKQLVSYMHEAKKLAVLDLSGNVLGPTVLNLADQLKHMHLKELHLSNTSLSDADIDVLIHAIGKMPYHCILYITKNPDITFGSRLDSLRNIPCYQQLDPHSSDLESRMKAFVPFDEVDFPIAGFVPWTGRIPIVTYPPLSLDEFEEPSCS